SGVGATLGALFLVVLTLLPEGLVQKPSRKTSKRAQSRNALRESPRRNSEALVTMGMVQHLTESWSKVNSSYLASNRSASDAAGGFGAIARVLRLMLQSAVLGVGAYLVIYQQASAGIIIAGSIRRARRLSPTYVAIAHWRGWVAARQSW